MGRPKKVKVVEVHPLQHLVGSLVKYYDEGWRHGYLESIKSGTGNIKPVAGFKAIPRCIKISMMNVEAE